MKSLKEVLAIGVLATATACLVGQSKPVTPKQAQRGKPVAQAIARTTPQQPAIQAGSDEQWRTSLEERVPVPKLPNERLAQAPADSNGRLIVKFTDAVAARVDANSKLASATTNLNAVQALIDQFGASLSPAIVLDEGVMEQMRDRAAQRSGKQQPDIGGMMYVDGMPGVLPGIALALNALDIVEFVEFDVTYDIIGGGDTGACCLAANAGCDDTLTEFECAAVNGSFLGVGTSCGPGGLACGACCVDLECQEPDDFDFPLFTEGECNNIGGEFFEGLTDCIDVSCGGACCLPDMGCADTQDEVDEALCTAGGGTWFPGESCLVFNACGGCCVGGECDEEVFTAPITPFACEQQGGIPTPGIMCPDADCDTGSCCIEMGTICVNVPNEAACVDAGGTFLNGDCDAELECGGCVGDCGVVHAGVFCNNLDCCNAVCGIDPFCCDLDNVIIIPGRKPFGVSFWDPWCVQHAAELCGFEPPCAASTGPCTEVHDGVGCSVTFCCELVCEADPFCCTFEWDEGCAGAAGSICLGVPGFGRCEIERTDGSVVCVDLAEEALCAALDGEPGIASWEFKVGESCNDLEFTPNWSVAQGYLTVAPYDAAGLLVMDNVLPKVNGVPLAGFDGQGYDVQALWEFAETISGYTGSPNLTRGKSMKVGVIEHTARVDWTDPNDPTKNHEELVGKIIPEPGQTQIIIEGDGALGANHGTACLGIIGAKDEDNSGNPAAPGLSPAESYKEETGVVGVAPEADLYFFPIVSVEQPSGRLLSAIANAIAIFDPGDVLSFSIGPGGGGTLASSQANWTLLRFASDSGITCCLAAGNDSFNLDDNPQAGGADSGAVIVGASYPGADGFNVHCRLPFSNYCDDCTPASAVHVNAWGERVTTIGYGALYAPPKDGENDPTRHYTHTFNGTSAACPQVAGAVACMQGLAKMIYGIPLMPEQIRDVVSNGTPQCGGTPLGSANAGSGDFDPDEDVHSIGVYTDFFDAAVTMVQTSYFDDNDTFHGDVVIAKGKHIYGNNNSMRAADGNYLVVQSELTEPGESPNSLLALPAPGGTPWSTGLSPEETSAIMNFLYIINGHITDVVLVGSTDLAPTEFAAAALETQLPGGDNLRFTFAYLYDWVAERWQFIDLQAQTSPDPLPPGAAPGNGLMVSEIGTPFRYVNPDTKNMMIRYWTFGFNTNGLGIGDPSSGYIERHDFVDIGAANDFGVDPGP